MKIDKIVIEVKTDWNKTNDGYERQIIEYGLPQVLREDEKMYAEKFLKEINSYTETSQNIISSNPEVNLKYTGNNKFTYEENNFINNLINYTKKQWEIE